MNDDGLRRRPDGTYEEVLGIDVTADYAEEPDTGLWRVDVFKDEVNEWRSSGYASLEEAREAARGYYAQL